MKVPVLYQNVVNVNNVIVGAVLCIVDVLCNPVVFSFVRRLIYHHLCRITYPILYLNVYTIQTNNGLRKLDPYSRIIAKQNLQNTLTPKKNRAHKTHTHCRTQEQNLEPICKLIYTYNVPENLRLLYSVVF